MRTVIGSFLRRYWQFSTALLFAVVSLGFQIWGPEVVVHWILGTGAVLLTIPLIMGMWQDFRSGKYGLDILALTAIYTSVILNQSWAAIVIAIMLTGGEALEDYAESRAHRELKSLLERAPQQAHVTRGRKTLDISAQEVRTGDKILIKPGEIVPVDAEIIEGSGSFDEASLTGESVPVAKSVGEQILSGSINQDGAITAKAIHSAADSQYQQIIKLVQSANADQTPFVRLADRYSVPFTITAFIIAGAAWFIGRDAHRFLEVIVVATPCPLLLAAPIALVSGMARASKHGIIVRTGSALEKLAEVETMAFDKTGTLTDGKPAVDAVLPANGFTAQQVLTAAASLEQSSSHVLAQTIVSAAIAKKYTVAKAKHVKEYPGRGVQASWQGGEVLVGQPAFLKDHGAVIESAALQAKTATYIAIKGQFAGAITFHDQPRSEAKSMITALKKLGIKQFLMVTGDNQVAAKAVAKQVGISEVIAGASPGDKLHAIDKIEGRPVAFVGDGVNDAPVLTTADIGIALGARGSTAASESADIVIMPNSLTYVTQAVQIAQRTFSIAKQSIVIGIALSFVLMAAFATGHFSALLGAVLQEVVDVFVIFNALRAHFDGKQAS